MEGGVLRAKQADSAEERLGNSAIGIGCRIVAGDARGTDFSVASDELQGLIQITSGQAAGACVRICRSFGDVEHVGVEVDIQSPRLTRKLIQRGGQPVKLVRSDAHDPRRFEERLFFNIKVAHSNLDNLFLGDRREVFEPGSEIAPASAGQYCQAHSIEKSGGRCFRRVEICVGIEPD